MKCTTLKVTKPPHEPSRLVYLLRRPVPRLRFMSGLLHPLDRITSSAHKEPVSWKIVGDCASQRCSPETSKISQESMWRLEKAWQTSEQAFQIGTFPLRIRSAGRCVHPGSSFSLCLKFDSDIFSQGAAIPLRHLEIILLRNTIVFQNRVMRYFLRIHGPTIRENDISLRPPRTHRSRLCVILAGYHP